MIRHGQNFSHPRLSFRCFTIKRKVEHVIDEKPSMLTAWDKQTITEFEFRSSQMVIGDSNLMGCYMMSVLRIQAVLLSYATLLSDAPW